MERIRECLRPFACHFVCAFGSISMNLCYVTTQTLTKYNVFTKTGFMLTVTFIVASILVYLKYMIFKQNLSLENFIEER